MKLRLFQIMIYAACVVISREYCASYWVVGGVFALAWLIIRWTALDKQYLKALLFIAVSTLVYALVYGLESHGWRFEHDLIDIFFGSLSAGVVMGSILLPYLHAFIFSGKFKQNRAGLSFLLILSWYFSVLLSVLDQASGLPGSVDYLLIAIALWQGIYLRYFKI